MGKLFTEYILNSQVVNEGSELNYFGELFYQTFLMSGCTMTIFTFWTKRHAIVQSLMIQFKFQRNLISTNSVIQDDINSIKFLEVAPKNDECRNLPQKYIRGVKLNTYLDLVFTVIIIVAYITSYVSQVINNSNFYINLMFSPDMKLVINSTFIFNSYFTFMKTTIVIAVVVHLTQVNRLLKNLRHSLEKETYIISSSKSFPCGLHKSAENLRSIKIKLTEVFKHHRLFSNILGRPLCLVHLLFTFSTVNELAYAVETSSGSYIYLMHKIILTVLLLGEFVLQLHLVDTAAEKVS